MTAQDFKISISGLLYNVEDVTVLEACFQLLEKHLVIKEAKSKQKVVGFDPDGQPVNIAQLEKRVTEAIDRVKNGQGVKHHDLIRLMESW
jgi:hypothetical protein